MVRPKPIVKFIQKIATEKLKFGCQQRHQVDDAQSFRNIALNLQAQSTFRIKIFDHNIVILRVKTLNINII
jgi:membrane protease subunit (stomatin/prohibitin family)